MFRKRQINIQCFTWLIILFGAFICFKTYFMAFFLGFMDTCVVSLWPQKSYHLINKFNHEF